MVGKDADQSVSVGLSAPGDCGFLGQVAHTCVVENSTRNGNISSSVNVETRILISCALQGYFSWVSKDIYKIPVCRCSNDFYCRYTEKSLVISMNNNGTMTTSSLLLNSYRIARCMLQTHQLNLVILGMNKR